MGCGFTEEQIELMKDMLLDIAFEDYEPSEEKQNLWEWYIDRAYSNPDPVIRAELSTCPKRGEIPTPDEFLLWFLPQLLEDLEF